MIGYGQAMTAAKLYLEWRYGRPYYGDKRGYMYTRTVLFITATRVII